MRGRKRTEEAEREGGAPSKCVPLSFPLYAQSSSQLTHPPFLLSPELLSTATATTNCVPLSEAPWGGREGGRLGLGTSAEAPFSSPLLLCLPTNPRAEEQQD